MNRVYALFALTLLPGHIPGQVRDMSDSDLIVALASPNRKTAAGAVREIVHRGARMFPFLFALRGNGQLYTGGGLGSGLRSQIAFDAPTGDRAIDRSQRITLELLGLYLITAIYEGRVDFAMTPFLVDLSIAEKARQPSNDRRLIGRGWNSATRWLERQRKEGIEKLRAEHEAPLSGANLAFW